MDGRKIMPPEKARKILEQQRKDANKPHPLILWAQKKYASEVKPNEHRREETLIQIP